MKTIATFTEDGFPGSLETIKFIKEMNDDLYTALVALIGTGTVFIKGGTITVLSGNTTITDGIIMKDGKLYTFTGGTFAGLPAALNVLFETGLSAGYDPVYFENDPISKDVYLDNTARIDASGTIVLDTVGYIDSLVIAKPILDSVSGKAGKNASAAVVGATPGSGFTVVASSLSVKEYEDGTIKVFVLLSFSGTKAKGTAVLNSLPNSGDLNRPIPVFLTDTTTGEFIGNCTLSGTTLSVFNGFTSPINGCYASFTYKKA